MPHHHHHHRYLDVYCCLSHEFLHVYHPQVKSLFNRRKHQNRNALERTFQSKQKKEFHSNKRTKVHYANSIDPFERRLITSKKSFDHQIEFHLNNDEVNQSNRYDHSFQMANGDNKMKNIIENILNQFQHRSNKEDNQLSSFNHRSKRRKHQINIHESIEIQRQYPFMLSPLVKKSTSDQIKINSNLKTDSNSSIISIQSLINSIEISKENNDNQISEMNSQRTISSHDIENIEQFQPCIEIISPSAVSSIYLNNIFSSILPTLSIPNNKSIVFHSDEHSNENISNLNDILLIEQQSKQVRSLSESIEELCRLIRQFLHYELTEQNVTPLQATIANRLALILTYLVVPDHQKIISNEQIKKTIDKMISTNDEEVHFSTIGTQTNLKNDSIILSPNKIQYSHIESMDKHQISSFDERSQEISELISMSRSVYLPGHRLNHALSDTYIYRIDHYRQYPLSYHQFNSFSETNIYSLNKKQTKDFKQKFQQYIELESSNTCLEVSTEFTPDFLVTTTNNSKYDEDDQTEQFGIDIKYADCQIDTTISLITDKNQENIDTLAFNSTEKENYDSLEIDLEEDNDKSLLFNSFDIHRIDSHFNEEFNLEENNLMKNFINENNSLVFNNTSCLTFDNHSHSPILHRNTYQWQLPILPRRTNSIDVNYDRCLAKVNLKYKKIQSNSHNGIHFIGKQVRIKSNSLLSNKRTTINYNNNCCEYMNSRELSTQSSSTSHDSFVSFEDKSLDNISNEQCNLLPSNLHLLIDHTELGKTPSRLSEVTDKLDVNIAMVETLLGILNPFDNCHTNNSSMIKLDLFHMHIRQFLIEFDARIRLGRKKRHENTQKKYTISMSLH